MKKLNQIFVKWALFLLIHALKSVKNTVKKQLVVNSNLQNDNFLRIKKYKKSMFKACSFLLFDEKSIFIDSLKKGECMKHCFWIVFLSSFRLCAFEATDFGSLYPTHVKQIVYPKTIQEVQSLVYHARQKHQIISIAGARHSQGGHSNATNSINIDMLHMNKLIGLDIKHKVVKV